MLKGIDVIYWINLERAKTRRADMNAMFRDSVFDGIPINRVSAFDHKTTDTMSHFTLQKSDYKATVPEYTNFLSHIETIRGFSNSDYSDDAVALIMEDDITLEYKPYWKKSVKTVIQNAPKDWQVIMLNYIIRHLILEDVTKYNEYEKNNDRFSSACAFLIRKNTCKELIKEMYKNGKYTLDLSLPIRYHWFDVYLFSKLTTYAYKYPYFPYKTYNNSYLHLAHLKNHKNSKLYISKVLYGIDARTKRRRSSKTSVTSTRKNKT